MYPSPRESQPLTNGTRGQVHSGTGIHRKGFCQRVCALFQSHGVKLGYLYSYTKLHIYIYIYIYTIVHCVQKITSSITSV